MLEPHGDELRQKLFAGQLLLVVLTDVYDWCGHDYPRWEEVENAIDVAGEAGIAPYREKR